MLNSNVKRTIGTRTFVIHFLFIAMSIEFLQLYDFRPIYKKPSS